MENFKEIAEKCLAGELSGRFVCRDGLHISSFTLSRTDNPLYPYKLYRVGKLTIDGHTPNKRSHNDIIQFVPYEEMKQEQIKIDIPEGKVPVMEQTEYGVVITWKEKELTYNDIYHDLVDKDQHVSVPRYCNNNCNSQQFSKKVEVLRKLANIRNYFGKPKYLSEGYIIKTETRYCGCESGTIFIEQSDRINYSDNVVFATREHAQEAINILCDELKYLFEPW